MALFDFLMGHPTVNPSQTMPVGLLSTGQPSGDGMTPDPNASVLAPTMTQDTMQTAPSQGPREGGLLGGMDWRNLALAVGTALRAHGGDQNAWGELANTQMRQMQMAQMQRQVELQRRGNQAFRAAYQNGKFDPKVYAEVMGDALDPKAMAEIAATVRPKVSYQNDRILKEDQLTGDVTDAGQLPMGYAEQTAAANSAETGRHNLATEGHEAATLQETGRHNRVEEGQGSARIGIEGANLGVAQGHLQLDKINAARAANPGAPVIASPQDYARFGGGTYIAPDGSVRVKPRTQ